MGQGTQIVGNMLESGQERAGASRGINIGRKSKGGSA